MALDPPFLSEYDQEAQSEGGVDALGLQAIYERLADRILPAMTVRMSRPRFVTAIALGSVVCADWGEDAVAKDGCSPAWMVFEWFVAESLVRCQGDLRDAQRIPGRRKIEAALRQKRAISAASYLKTASIFGFTGIYKRLAIGVGVVTDDLAMDEAGYELITAWERDNDMLGFRDARGGAGAELREKLKRAVTQGMDQGRTVPLPGSLYEQIAKLTEPAGAGRNEAKVLSALLRRHRKDPAMSSEVVDAVRENGALIDRYEEPAFLRKTARRASQELKLRLGAIDAYEALCRPVVDTFDLIRRVSSRAARAPIGLADLEGPMREAKLAERVRQAVGRVQADPALLDREPEVRPFADCFAAVSDAGTLFRAVLDRHDKAQKDKPPHGKLPWIDRLPRDQVSVRAGYMLDNDDTPPEYAHEYRTASLSRFLDDLGSLS